MTQKRRRSMLKGRDKLNLIIAILIVFAPLFILFHFFSLYGVIGWIFFIWVAYNAFKYKKGGIRL